MTFLLVIFWLITGGGCGGLRVGPFIPQNPLTCGSDQECPVGYECRFPAVNTHAVCMGVGFEGTWSGEP